MPQLDALPMGAHRLFALTDERLLRASGVLVAFTSREGGVSGGVYESLNTASHVGDDLASVLRNREIVLEAVGAEGCEIVVPNQVHGSHVVDIWEPEEVASKKDEAAQSADGVLVGVPNVAALLNGADCPLCAIVSPSGRFAVVHAGWRGAIAGIASKAVNMLSQGDSRDPAGFNAYIGPHIGPECFEVSAEIAQRFSDAYGPAAAPDARHVSLSQAICADLVSAGMDASRVVSAGICTKCHPDQFFSYRASGGQCGRHAAVTVKLEK